MLSSMADGTFRLTLSSSFLGPRISTFIFSDLPLPKSGFDCLVWHRSIGAPTFCLRLQVVWERPFALIQSLQNLCSIAFLDILPVSWLMLTWLCRLFSMSWARDKDSHFSTIILLCLQSRRALCGCLQKGQQTTNW